MKPTLEKLKNICINKVKNFLNTKLMEFKKPKTDIRNVKEDLLLYKYYLQFLQKHSTNSAYKDIRTTYQDILSKIYTFNFNNFIQELVKQETKVAPTPDLLIEIQATSTLFGQKVQTKQTCKFCKFFTFSIDIRR